MLFPQLTQHNNSCPILASLGSNRTNHIRIDFPSITQSVTGKLHRERTKCQGMTFSRAEKVPPKSGALVSA